MSLRRGASRGIRTCVKTLADDALLDAKTARLLGFSFPLKTSVFGDLNIEVGGSPKNKKKSYTI